VPQSSSTTARTFLVDTLKRRPSRLLSQQERLLAPLVPLKKLRGEVPASQPRNHKRKFSYARLEHFIPVPVAVPLAFFGAFVGLALSCSGTKASSIWFTMPSTNQAKPSSRTNNPCKRSRSTVTYPFSLLVVEIVTLLIYQGEGWLSCLKPHQFYTIIMDTTRMKRRSSLVSCLKTHLHIGDLRPVRRHRERNRK